MALGASFEASASISIGIGGGSSEKGPDAPLHMFRFRLSFTDESLPNKSGGSVELCKGAFSEVSGLEATMEPKTFREGGRNFGQVHRAGGVNFATVVLKRGITPAKDLWRWFELVGGGAVAYRIGARIEILDIEGNTQITWRLKRALPVKFKAADLNARANEVGVEELHLVHEGMERVS